MNRDEKFSPATRLKARVYFEVYAELYIENTDEVRK